MTGINVKSPATNCGAYIYFVRLEKLFSFDADEFTIARAFNFEFDFTVFQSKQSVVFAATHVGTSVEFGAALTNDDAACQYCFAAKAFYAQTFSF